MMRWSSPLEAFVLTAERRSFSGAAQRLGVSPAAVSKAVARLEEELGVRLLERTSRRVVPTPAGVVLQEHGRRALDTLQAAVDRIGATRETPQGRLRLSASHVLGVTLVAALPRLRDRHPHLEVDLRLSDHVVDLAAEDVDIALRIGRLADSGLLAHRLAPLRWRLVASPAYLARAGTPRRPAELSEHACIKFVRPGGGLAEWTLRPTRDADPEPIRTPSPIRLDGGPLIVEAVLAGLGVALVFDFLVKDALASGQLVEVLPGYTPDPVPLTALMLPGRRDLARVRAGLDLLDDVLG